MKKNYMIIVLAICLTAAAAYVYRTERHGVMDFVAYLGESHGSVAVVDRNGLYLLDAAGGNIKRGTLLRAGDFSQCRAAYYGGRQIFALSSGNALMLVETDGTTFDTLRLNNVRKIVDICFYPSAGQAELLFIITGNGGEWYGDRIEGYSLAGRLQSIYSKDMTDYNPWGLKTADVDGDGEREVSVGVYKTSPLHPVMAKRPFIYDWDGDHLRPKWLGSRLSRPFSDYVFADLNRDGTDEIIALEMLQDESCAVHAYEWNGFGFTALAQSDASDLYEGIGVSDIDGDGRTGIHVKFKQGQHTGFRIIAYNGEKLETLHTILCKDPGKIDILDGIAVYSSRGRIYATELPDMGI